MTTKINYNQIKGAPANVLDFGAVGDGFTNDAAAVQAAVDGTLSQIEFPDGYYAIGTQVSINSTSPQNLTFIGARTNSYIAPTVNFSATPSLNTMIQNKKQNGKLSFKNIRFAADPIGNLPVGGFTGYYVSCDYQISPQLIIFSGEIDSCWYSPSSVTAGFLRGAIQNYSVRNSTWEGCRAVFTLVGIYNYDIIYSNNVFYSGYYGFIDASQNATQAGNVGVTANSATATSASSAQSWIGQMVHGIGIPIGTIIISAVNGVSFTMDRVSSVTNAALPVRIEIATRLITIDTLHSYGQQIDYLLIVKGANIWNVSNITLHNSIAPIGNIGLLSLENFSDVNVNNFQAIQSQGGTGLSTALYLKGGQGTFSNGIISGATIGLSLAGLAMPIELTFTNVNFTNCGYAFNIAAASTIAGKIVFTNCKFNNSTGYGIVDLSSVHNIECDFYNCEIINAGMDGVASGRNIEIAIPSGKVWRFFNCTIGQNDANAAAGYYVSSTGPGIAEFYNTTWLGTPPTALLTVASRPYCKFFPQRGSGGTVASATSITLPLSGDIFYISGTTSITSIDAVYNSGRTVTFVFTGALTFTDAISNLKLAGNFVTSADDCITLLCDGTDWYETSRSAN